LIVHTNITGRYNRNFKRFCEKARSLCGDHAFRIVGSLKRDSESVRHQTRQPLRSLEKSLRRKLRRDQNAEQTLATRVIRK
jgi:hypothetical protein